MLQLNEAIMQELMAEIGLLKDKVTQLEQQQNNLPPHTQPIHKTSRRRLIKQGLFASGSTIGVFGSAETGTGVFGKSNNWFGVRGDSNGVGGYFYGGKASLWLTSGHTSIPAYGNHSRGEIAASNESDDTTSLYLCTKGNNSDPGTWVRLNQPYTAGANITISPRNPDGTFTIAATSNIVFLTSPVRVAASTNYGGTFPVLVSDGSESPAATFQTIQITGITLPANAKGIIGSLTSVGATSAGDLRLWTFGNSTPAITTHIIPARPDGTGFNLSTSFTVGLGAEGKINLGYSNGIAGTTCGFSVDVVAYVV